MAIRVIDDSKLQDIAVAIQGKDGGGTMTVDQMPTRIEQNLQSKAVLDSVIDGSITSIESDVTIVRNNAFRECNKIVTVNFPHAIEIGEYAFSSYYTGVLTTAIFPSATQIKSYAFRYCTKLAVTNFLSVEKIDGNAFGTCSYLQHIYLPNLQLLGTGAFASCGSLNVVILGKRASLISANAFYDCPAIIYVKPEDLSWYSTATNWSTLYAQDRIKSIEDLTGDDLVWYQEQLALYPIEEAS